MTRARLNFWLDGLNFLAFLCLMTTGTILKFIVPSGTGGYGFGWRGGRAEVLSNTTTQAQKFFLGLHRQDWLTIHFYLALTFITLVVVHIILHWTWIKCMIFKSREKRSPSH